MTIDDLLAALDRAAAEHKIPSFTWEQETVLAARLHLLGDGRRWAVAIEMLVFWPENGGFQGRLRGATSEAAFHHRWLPLEPAQIEYDESMNAVGPAAFVLHERTLPVDWSACHTLAEEHGTMAELEAMARICDAHRDELLLSPATVSERVHGLRGLAVTDRWRHPDIERKEEPSSIADWRAFAEILHGGEPVSFTHQGEPNTTDWRRWFALANR